MRARRDRRPRSASHAVRGPGYHARQGWFGRALTAGLRFSARLVGVDGDQLGPIMRFDQRRMLAANQPGAKEREPFHEETRRLMASSASS